MLRIKKARPLDNGVFVTCEKYDKDVVTNGIIESGHTAGNVKEYQTVYAVGRFVQSIEPGQLVKINLGRYAVHRFEENSIKNDLMEDKIIRYNTPLVEIDGKTYMHIQANDVMYIIEEFEEVEDSDIIVMQPQIIMA